MRRTKRCPFCGAGGATWNYFLTQAKDAPTRYVIECPGCAAQSAPKATVEMAVEAWNRRA